VLSANLGRCDVGEGGEASSAAGGGASHRAETAGEKSEEWRKAMGWLMVVVGITEWAKYCVGGGGVTMVSDGLVGSVSCCQRRVVRERVPVRMVTPSRSMVTEEAVNVAVPP
jgi:hypothetical protein